MVISNKGIFDIGMVTVVSITVRMTSSFYLVRLL